jgi:hypothetical protein
MVKSVALFSDFLRSDDGNSSQSRCKNAHFSYCIQLGYLGYATPGTASGHGVASSPGRAPPRPRVGRVDELDVVVSADPPREKSRVLAIGEVKATKWLVGLNQLERLQHIRSSLSVDAIAREPKPLLFSRQGFTPELAAEAHSQPDVALIDLHRLYQGS